MNEVSRLEFNLRYMYCERECVCACVCVCVGGGAWGRKDSLFVSRETGLSLGWLYVVWGGLDVVWG